jgi:hypothetical protein
MEITLMQRTETYDVTYQGEDYSVTETYHYINDWTDLTILNKYGNELEGEDKNEIEDQFYKEQRGNKNV